MISYAQNFEDVILARVFRHRHGFYVDVGAHFPVIDSVTEHFHRLGWRGINIEPLAAAYAELRAARPRDVNLHCAIAETPGAATLHAIDGLSTLRADIATGHGRADATITVATTTLALVLEQYAAEPIDFLKIDVEGAEASVIRSNDWARFRPAMLVIEAIHPVSHAACHDDWEPLLIDAGYHCALFDGLNRFYWNDELPAPPDSCFLPPNVLDGFTCFSQIAAAARAAEAVRVAQFERLRCAAAERELAEVREALGRLRTEFLEQAVLLERSEARRLAGLKER